MQRARAQPDRGRPAQHDGCPLGDLKQADRGPLGTTGAPVIAADGSSQTFCHPKVSIDHDEGIPLIQASDWRDRRRSGLFLLTGQRTVEACRGGASCNAKWSSM